MIHIVDAPTGRGKTNAAINYMNTHDERFLFVTPYIDEQDRIIKDCEKKFCKPEAIYENKSRVITKKNGIKRLFREKKNIVTTHALFKLFDYEIIDYCKQYNYTLILDEVTEVIDDYDDLKEDDLKIMLRDFVTVDNCMLKWREDQKDYSGNKFLKEKCLCEMNCLSLYGSSTMLWQFSVDIFKAFKESFILTYMFDGQMQKYYYDFHNLEYDRWYVKGKSLDTFELTTEWQDYGKPSQYKPLIEICDNKKMNAVGEDYYALSHGWFESDKHQDEVLILRKNMLNYFQNVIRESSKKNMWTCYKDDYDTLRGDGYTKGFLACNTKATNKHKDRCNLAYVINMFMNPYIFDFFSSNGISVDENIYSLSSLIQWVWRSSIRDRKPIKIYIPSSRMRNLFTKWLNDEMEVG